MPTMAKTIAVTRTGNSARIDIDGEEFAWYVGRGDITVNVNPDEAPTVTITLIADKVVVSDELSPASS